MFIEQNYVLLMYVCMYVFYGTSTAYGSSQARGWAQAAALIYDSAAATLDTLTQFTSLGIKLTLQNDPSCRSRILNPLCCGGNSGIMLLNEVPMGSVWGWDMFDFFFFLFLILLLFYCFLLRHLLNKSPPFKPLGSVSASGESDLDRWRNVRTCHSHGQEQAGITSGLDAKM